MNVQVFWPNISKLMFHNSKFINQEWMHAKYLKMKKGYNVSIYSCILNDKYIIDINIS